MAKSTIFGKGRKYKKTYTRFLDRWDGKADTLLGERGGGCSCVGGVLRCGVGVSPVANDYNDPIFLEHTPVGVFTLYRRDERTILGSFVYGYTTETEYYEYDYETGGFILKQDFGKPVKVVTAHAEDHAAYTFFVERGGVWRSTLNGNISKVTSIVRIRDVREYKGRVFFAYGDKTVVSSLLYSPAEWDAVTNGEWIDLPVERGKILSFAVLNDKLYALFEYGIVLLRFDGELYDFSIEELDYSGGKIVQGSAATVADGGGRVFFLAENGVYCFDGRNVELVVAGEELSLNTMEECVAAAFCGQYYLQYTDEAGVKRALVVDGKSKEWYDCKRFIGVAQSCGRVLAAENGVLCELAPHKVGGRFSVVGCDFGSRRRKCLEEITLKGRGQVRVQIDNGKKTKTVDLTLVEGGVTVSMRMLGTAYDIVIQPQEDAAEVKAFSAVYEVLGADGSFVGQR